MDWNKVEKGAKIIGEGIKRYSEQEEKRLKRKFEELLCKATDSKVRYFQNTLDYSDWRYDIVEKEARRRRL